MTRLEKTLFNAIEDANTTNAKINTGIIEDNKSYSVKRSNKSLTLYCGDERAVVVDSDIYTALAVKIFLEYIKF